MEPTLSLYEILKKILIEKISTPNRSIKEPEFKERIIHNFQVLPSMGFNASHSAVENVVIITGKLISLPYGLKAGLNSESLYQQLYFLLCFSAHHVPPLCLPLSLFSFIFFFSALPSSSPMPFSLTGPSLPPLSHTV